MGGRVYVVHAGADGLAALSIAEAVEPDVSCFVAARDAPSGGGAARASLRALADADAALIVLGEGSADDPTLEREIGRVVDLELPIVAVRLAPVEPHARLREDIDVFAWVDAFAGSTSDQVGDLTTALRQALGEVPQHADGDETFDLFVSHSTTDAMAAHALVSRLEPEVRCWIAPRDIPPGTSWPDGIVLGVERCRALALLFSPDAADSQWVYNELRMAMENDRPILPIRLTDVTPKAGLRLFLGSHQWVDAFPGQVDAHLDAMATAVHEVLGLAQRVDSARPVAEPVTSPPAAGPGDGGAEQADPWLDPAAAADAAEAALAAIGADVDVRERIEAQVGLAELEVAAARIGAARVFATEAMEAARTSLAPHDELRVTAEVTATRAEAAGWERTAPQESAMDDLVERTERLLGADHPVTLRAAVLQLEVLWRSADPELAERRGRSLMHQLDRVFDADAPIAAALRIDAAVDAFLGSPGPQEPGAVAPNRVRALALLGDAPSRPVARAGTDHPLAVVAGCLATLWSDQSSSATATEVVDRADERLGRRHPGYSTVVQCAWLWARNQQDWSVAAVLAEEALDVSVALGGPLDPNALAFLSRLSESASQAGNHERAAEASRDLLARRREQHGADSPLTLKAARYLALDHKVLDRPREAIDLLRQALADAPSLDPSDPERLRAQVVLRDLLAAVGDDDGAATVATAAWHHARDVFGRDDPATRVFARTSRDGLVRSGRAGEADEQAISLIGPYLDGTATVATDSPDLDQVLVDHVMAFRSLGRRGQADQIEAAAASLWPVVDGHYRKDGVLALELGAWYVDAQAHQGTSPVGQRIEHVWDRLCATGWDAFTAAVPDAERLFASVADSFLSHVFRRNEPQVGVRGSHGEALTSLLLLDQRLRDLPTSQEPESSLRRALLAAKAVDFPAGNEFAQAFALATLDDTIDVVREPFVPAGGQLDPDRLNAATRALTAAATQLGKLTLARELSSINLVRRGYSPDAQGVVSSLRTSPGEFLSVDYKEVEDLLWHAALTWQHGTPEQITQAMSLLDQAFWGSTLRPGPHYQPYEPLDAFALRDDDRDPDEGYQLGAHLALACLRRGSLMSRNEADIGYGAHLFATVLYQFNVMDGNDLGDHYWLYCLRRRHPGCVPESVEALLEAFQERKEEEQEASTTPEPAAPKPGVDTSHLSWTQRLVVTAVEAWAHQDDGRAAAPPKPLPPLPGEADLDLDGDAPLLRPSRLPNGYLELRELLSRSAKDGTLFAPAAADRD